MSLLCWTICRHVYVGMSPPMHTQHWMQKMLYFLVNTDNTLSWVKISPLRIDFEILTSCHTIGTLLYRKTHMEESPLFKLWALHITCGKGHTFRHPLNGIHACVFCNILINCCHGPFPWARVGPLKRQVENIPPN